MYELALSDAETLPEFAALQHATAIRFPVVVLLEKLTETVVPLVVTLVELLWTTETVLCAGVARSKDRKPKDRSEINRIR